MQNIRQARTGTTAASSTHQESWTIVERQPRTSQYIFPYDPKSVGAAFTRATRLLGIADLRFHDLRHEATSRLFESGYQIHEVAQFTLHDSWNELKRYANLKPEEVRDITPPTMQGGLHDRRRKPVLMGHRPSLVAGQSARRGRPH